MSLTTAVDIGAVAAVAVPWAAEGLYRDDGSALRQFVTGQFVRIPLGIARGRPSEMRADRTAQLKLTPAMAQALGKDLDG